MGEEYERKPEVTERQLRKLRKSVHRKKRMSMCLRQGAARALAGNTGGCSSVLSPATPAKGKTAGRGKGRGKWKRNKRYSPVLLSFTRSSSAGNLSDKCDREYDEIRGENTVDIDALHEQILCESLGLNERNFDCDVIGGVYQHAFDDFKPVIAPISNASADKRVVGVYLRRQGEKCNCSLELKLFISRDLPYKNVDLGPSWIWTRAVPDGYLVSSEPLRPSSARSSRGRRPKRVDCYYLSRHPLEWAEALDER